MSVTMSLYKVNPDVVYTGYYFDNVSKADFIMGSDGFYPIEKKEKELGAPMKSDGHWPCASDAEYDDYEKWEESQKASAWSDGVEHEFYDITHRKMCYKGVRGWRRIRNRLEKFNHRQFKKKDTRNYLVLDIVEYAQGWFFKKRFFKKEITYVVCTTKREMENFFRQYVDFNGRDTRGREAVNRFMASWEDGMIFECAW